MWTLISLCDGNSEEPVSGRLLEEWCLAYPNTPDRPLQRDVIVAALDGNDVFVQAATGFGKSLCFQLPAVIDHGSKYNGNVSRSLEDIHFDIHTQSPSLYRRCCR